MPWPMCCSAITTPAANCRLPFRARPAICRRFTTTSRRPGAVICSTMSRRCIAFGFGLSYTTFSIGPPRLEKKKIRRNGQTRVLVDVTNTGQRPRRRSRADVHSRLVSSVTRPVKELKGFQRVSLEPGETKTVALEITPDRWRFTTST